MVRLVKILSLAFGLFLGAAGAFAQPIYGPLQTQNASPGVVTTSAGVVNTLGNWISYIVTGTYPSEVVCGVTDATALLQTDLNFYSSLGGGKYQLGSKPCIIGTSASLNIPANVGVVGGPASQGATSSSLAYGSAPYTFLIGSYPVTYSQNTSLFGVTEIRQGFSLGSTMRARITAVKNFSGTANSCSGTSDVNLRDLTIIGFTNGIIAACDRMNGENIRADDTNPLAVTVCNDTCTYQNVEAWPFANPPDGVAQFQTTNISSVSNSGGLIEISFAAAPSTPIVTGDTIVINNVGGVPANSRWTATAIDTTDFTLNGSTFSGTYTSGGTAFLNGLIRHGTAAKLTATGGGPYISNLTTFGYDVAVDFNGAVGAHCDSCWIDNVTVANNYDPAPVGVLSENGAIWNVYSGFLNSPGPDVIQNSSGTLQLTNVQTGLFGYLAGVKSIQVNAGSLAMTGGWIISSNGAASGNFYVADAATRVTLNGVGNFNNIPFTFQSTTDCQKAFVDGTAGPCSWSPLLYGATTAGTSTPATNYPAGAFTLNSAGIVHLWGHVLYTAFSGATGNTVIGALPITPGTGISSVDNVACAVGRASGVTLTTLYTQLTADLSAGVSIIGLDQIGSGQSVAAINSALLSSTPELDFSCTYHK